MGLQYLTITCLSYGVNFVGMPFHASSSLLNAFCVIYFQGTTHFGMQNLASNTWSTCLFRSWLGWLFHKPLIYHWILHISLEQLHLLDCKRKGRSWPNPILKLSISAWLQLNRAYLLSFLLSDLGIPFSRAFRWLTQSIGFNSTTTANFQTGFKFVSWL